MKIKNFKMNLSITSISVQIRKLKEKRRWGSSDRVCSLQGQSLEFKPQSYQKQNKKTAKGEKLYQ
jgi:hypothetical protein